MALSTLFYGTGAVARHTLTWTSDASGNYAEVFANVYGVILRVVTDPGTPAPTDDYDVSLVDEYGLDVMSGRGANRDTANSEGFCPLIAASDGTTTTAVPVAIAGSLTLTIANAGNAKQGSVVLFVR